MADMPLAGLRVATLAVNVPGPVAAARLGQLGAEVTKVEPPQGDPLAWMAPGWYAELCRAQHVIALDLKAAAGREQLGALLETCDLLLTSSRPDALARLGLAWPDLRRRYQRLTQVAIVGHPGAEAGRPGHDLTYQAHTGLLAPPALPRTLMVDLHGAERAVSAALALLLGRARGAGAGYAEVALVDSAEELALPLRHGLTAAGGVVGGGHPGYNLYRTSDGWIAVAALEPHFLLRLEQHLGLEQATREQLAALFMGRGARAWEQWASEHGLPIVALAT
jgi:alpha-methylacyl-CoA racemase